MAINTVIEQYPSDKVPNKQTQDKYTFAENVYRYLIYINDTFVPQVNEVTQEINDTFEFFTDDFRNAVEHVNENLDAITSVNDNITYVINVSNNINPISFVGENINAITSCYDNMNSIENLASNLTAINDVSNYMPYITDVSMSIGDVQKVADNLDELLNKADLVLSMSDYRAVFAKVTILTGNLVIYEYDLDLEIDDDGNLVLNNDDIDMKLEYDGSLIYYK